MKVKADFKNLNQSMQTQQKETDEEQDKKLKEIEDKVQAVQQAVGEAQALEENSQKLADMQTEMVTMQEKFQQKMNQVEASVAVPNNGPSSQAAQEVQTPSQPPPPSDAF